MRSCEITKISDVEEVVKSGKILSFEDKYLSGEKMPKFQKCNSKLAKNGTYIKKSCIKLCKTNIGQIARGNKKPSKNVPEDVVEKIKDNAKRAVELIEFFGVCRIDFLVDCEGNVFLNEINSVPGSLAYYFWNEGCFFDEIVGIAETENNCSKKFEVARFL